MRIGIGNGKSPAGLELAQEFHSGNCEAAQGLVFSRIYRLQKNIQNDYCRHDRSAREVACEAGVVDGHYQVINRFHIALISLSAAAGFGGVSSPFHCAAAARRGKEVVEETQDRFAAPAWPG